MPNCYNFYKGFNKLTPSKFKVHNFGDILQLVIVELIYKVCLANPSERSRFIRCIYNLLTSNSPSVRYEAAGTLVRKDHFINCIQSLN